MNSLLVELGIEGWKPLAASLLLPPVPLLLLLLAGAALLWMRRAFGWLLMALGLAGLWLAACIGTAEALAVWLLRPPPALQAAQIEALKRDVRANRKVAIVVLGGGRKAYAPEYDRAGLSRWSMERLLYGMWLAGKTGAPVAFSGGVGWAAQPGGETEAQIAARIASTQFDRPLRWTENESRDTRENAARTVELLKHAGVHALVLVTHGWHMPRALRAFEQASGGALSVTAAPMGTASGDERSALRWMPTTNGLVEVRYVLHEALGLLAGS